MKDLKHLYYFERLLEDANSKFRARVVLVGSEVDDVDVVRLIEESGAYVCADRFCYGSSFGRDS